MNSPFNIGADKALIKAQPLIVDAYKKLGEDRVRNLRYIKKDIEAALINADSESSNISKAAKMLYNKLGIGFYTTPGIGRDEVRIAYVLKKNDLFRALFVLQKALEAYPGRTI